MEKPDIVTGEDGLARCFWQQGSYAPYRHYHDEEWGRPVTDDIRLFEKICLEGFQSGLSWLTILKKRENFRAAFAGFDFERVARFGEADEARLLADPGIVRHRGKIAATINNAARAIELRAEYGSLARYFWGFEPAESERPREVTLKALAADPVPPSALRLSKDLKRRGWNFVGPTTVYSFMQAMGLVNDHLEGCHCRAAVDDMRARLPRP